MNTTLPSELTLLASAPTSTAGQTDMLRRRLALFAAACSCLSAFVMALGMAYACFLDGGSFRAVPVPAFGASLGALLLPALVWALLRRHQGSPAFLLGADVAVVLATLAGHGAHLLLVHSTRFTRFDLVLLLIPDLLLLARAVVVPSRARTTMAVSAVSSAVVMAVATVVGARLERAGLPHASVSAPLFVGLWSVAVGGVATLASHVLYGLRRKLSDSKKLGPYSLERKIGEGGMGEVYLAHHALLRRPTAVKLLPPERAGAVSIARFEREVRHTAALTHPNTVSIFDYGRTMDGTFYYAMEYLDGIDLQKLVDRYGPLDSGRAVHVLEQICASLGEAHAAGLVHRDVKPANVLLCERGGMTDVVKVLDFGW